MLSAVMIQILIIASLNKLNVMAVYTLDSEVLMILLWVESLGSSTALTMM